MNNKDNIDLKQITISVKDVYAFVNYILVTSQGAKVIQGLHNFCITFTQEQEVFGSFS